MTIKTRTMNTVSWERAASLIVFVIVTFIFTLDLWMHRNRGITFDGHVHITTIAQFATAITSGEFPVRWANGFTTYGFPLPLFAHQTTAYLGAFLDILIFGDPARSYVAVITIGVFFSILLFYYWLRAFVSRSAAQLGALLFTFAPYRIANVYVRGALPEFFSTIFVVMGLIGITQLWRGKVIPGIIWMILGTALLLLTHPMMVIPISILWLGAVVAMHLEQKRFSFRPLTLLLLCGVVGIMLASYYLLPLVLERGYFVYDREREHLRLGRIDTITTLLTSNFSYFGATHPGPPVDTYQIGAVETVCIFLALFVAIREWRRSESYGLWVWLVIGGVLVFLITPASYGLYRHFFFLDELQYPFRMLSAFFIIPPLLCALLFERWGNSRWMMVIVVAIAITRFPYLYGKNYMEYSREAYTYVQANLHTANFNTIWIDDPERYSRRIKPTDIIGGQGKISNVRLGNKWRQYHVSAQTPLKMLDYTFFYPGWLVWVDGKQVPIEFQDTNYRGMIIYHVPVGEHEVEVRFIETRIRKVGWVISLLGVLVFGGIIGTLYLWEKRRK